MPNDGSRKKIHSYSTSIQGINFYLLNLLINLCVPQYLRIMKTLYAFIFLK